MCGEVMRTEEDIKFLLEHLKKIKKALTEKEATVISIRKLIEIEPMYFIDSDEAEKLVQRKIVEEK